MRFQSCDMKLLNLLSFFVSSHQLKSHLFHAWAHTFFLIFLLTFDLDSLFSIYFKRLRCRAYKFSISRNENTQKIKATKSHNMTQWDESNWKWIENDYFPTLIWITLMKVSLWLEGRQGNLIIVLLYAA